MEVATRKAGQVPLDFEQLSPIHETHALLTAILHKDEDEQAVSYVREFVHANAGPPPGLHEAISGPGSEGRAHSICDDLQ